jgi:hypothetical protein
MSLDDLEKSRLCYAELLKHGENEPCLVPDCTGCKYEVGFKPIFDAYVAGYRDGIKSLNVHEKVTGSVTV